LGTLKPDAYLLLAGERVEDAWWIEVDQDTESRNTIRRKLSLYLLAAQAGVSGPDGLLPRVLVTVPGPRRLEVVRELVADLGPPATP
jgi:Replication-relaxation